MSADVVTEARAMLEQITPGEWRGDDECIVAAEDAHVVCFGHDYDQYGAIGARTSLLGMTTCSVSEWNHAAYDAEKAANVAFIAAAPRLVRGLLAEVERRRDGAAADSGICQPHRDLMKPEDGCPCEVARRRLAPEPRCVCHPSQE